MLACHTCERVLKRVGAHAKTTGMNADELKYPGSRRVYVQGTLNPQVQVSMREIVQEDTVFPDGRTEKNAPVRVYDCSGPWGDESFHGDEEQGLPTMRAEWIRNRGDVEEESDGSLRATSVATPPTQRYYALQGIVTPRWSMW